MARIQIQSMQVFRGLAALAVVVHHAALSTDAFVKSFPLSIKTVFDSGHIGVDFFFVLSGFIIMYAHMDDDRTLTALKRYAFKRLSRIYPAYLPIGLVMIVLYAMMPAFSASGGRGYSLLSSLLLIPAGAATALSVAWTLVHELMFYGVFLLFFVSWRCLVGGLFAWMVLIFVVNYSYTPTGWLRYPLNLLNIEFIVGVAAAWAVCNPKLQQKIGGLCFSALGGVIVLCVLSLMTQDNEAYLRLILAIGLAFVMVGFAVYEQSNTVRWPVFLLFMGNASYSIYLIHNPLLSITQRLAGRMQLAWPLAMVFGVILSVFAGWIYYRVVERPALRFFQQRLKK
ncbi:MAG: acyltransferase [Methylococcaceae bacterium]